MEIMDRASQPTRAALRIWGWMGRYRLSFYFACISVFCSYFGIADLVSGKKHNPNLWWGVAISATLALFLWFAQRRRLRYTVFQTSDGAAENYRRVLDVAVSNDWTICDDRKNELIAARIKAPWTALTWGELVTVEFSGSQVCINVVGDPYAGTSGSRTDAARAKAEIDAVVRVLRII
jgi:hypothetical protein